MPATAVDTFTFFIITAINLTAISGGGVGGIFPALQHSALGPHDKLQGVFALQMRLSEVT